MTEKEKIIGLINMAFKTITPWRKTWQFRDLREDAYIAGWNDCLGEIKENRKRYIAHLKKL